VSETNNTENVQYGLVVSFADQSASFVNGFECGKLAVHMTQPELQAIIEGERLTVHTENRVTIERLCAAYGWSAEWQATDYSEWSYVTLSRSVKPTERPNPHGLRIVASTPINPERGGR
jgi:hypothetical protein